VTTGGGGSGSVDALEAAGSGGTWLAAIDAAQANRNMIARIQR